MYRFEAGFVWIPLIWVAIILPNPLSRPLPILKVTVHPPENVDAEDTLSMNKSAPRNQNFDYLGIFLLVLVILFLVVALQFGGSKLPWSHPYIIGLLLGSGICAAAFLYAELSFAEMPLVPLGMLRSHSVLGSISCNMFTMTAYCMVNQNLPFLRCPVAQFFLDFLTTNRVSFLYHLIFK